MRFLEDQRTLSFCAALFLAIAGWGADFKTWADMLQVGNVFSLVAVIGGVLLAWVTKRPEWSKSEPEVKP
jgi:membrane associated rhomboid family serine protease